MVLQCVVTVIFRFYKAAYNEHNPSSRAQYRLGVIFLNGLYGVTQDADVGIRLVLHSASRGNTEAVCDVVTLYYAQEYYLGCAIATGLRLPIDFRQVRLLTTSYDISASDGCTARADRVIYSPWRSWLIV